MRINRLTIAGFGPYKTAQHIDFDAFADDGIFLITGNTGAGKSSILDAICFALYASVPRYEGTQQQLRSDHCEPGDPTYVELWFSTGGQNYRVRRSPDYEQPKKRGTGTTKKPAAAELFIRVAEASGGELIDESDWQGVAAIPREVGIALDGILGLSKDQFLQVILLARIASRSFCIPRTTSVKQCFRVSSAHGALPTSNARSSNGARLSRCSSANPRSTSLSSAARSRPSSVPVPVPVRVRVRVRVPVRVLRAATTPTPPTMAVLMMKLIQTMKSSSLQRLL